jgi:histone acetyltransferase (RNA polymerase elongator complex component)
MLYREPAEIVLGIRTVSEEPGRQKAMQQISKPFIVPVFLPHAGCPHRCVFCNQNAITRAPSGLPSESDLESAIARFLSYTLKRHSTIQIAFFGGNFLGLDIAAVESFLRLAQRFVQDGRVDSIRLSTRPDTIDRKHLDVLAGYSVRTVELGVQSMVDDVLRRSLRGHTVAQTVAAVKLLKAEGFAIGLQIMVGLPGDTGDHALETAHRLVDLQPDFVRIYPTIVLKRSLLAEWYRAGRFTPLSLDSAVELVKAIYVIFYRHDIPVVRMGLQAAGDLVEEDAVLAGPCHPAFGHLVHAALFQEMAGRLLSLREDRAATITVKTHPRSISKMKGLKLSNVDALRRQFNLRSLTVEPDPTLPIDGLRLHDAETVITYRHLAERRPF